MSMSTKIEDLPGSNLEQIPNAVLQNGNALQELPREILGDINLIKNDNDNRHLIKEEENRSNIKADIKRVHFEDESESVQENFKNIKEDINIISLLLNEENVLLLVLFLLSSQSDFDRYPKSIPFIGSYLSSPLIFTVIKCLSLVLIYRLTEYFILPKIKL